MPASTFYHYWPKDQSRIARIPDGVGDAAGNRTMNGMGSALEGMPPQLLNCPDFPRRDGPEMLAGVRAVFVRAVIGDDPIRW